MRSSAAAGAVSRPSQACTVWPLLCINIAPPPMPLDCGSTSASTICTAMAASSAEPPSRRMRKPASVASGLAAATMKCWADQPGFVVQPDADSGTADAGAGGAAGICAGGAVAAHPTSSASPQHQALARLRTVIYERSLATGYSSGKLGRHTRSTVAIGMRVLLDVWPNSSVMLHPRSRKRLPEFHSVTNTADGAPSEPLATSST